MKKYYAVLEIKEGASLGEIKKAYFRLAHRYHPDVCDDVDAEKKFKKIKLRLERFTWQILFLNN